MKFNHRVLQLRDQRKLSQKELSLASGISVRTIQRIEKDEVSPRPYTARKLLEALGVSLEDFNVTNNDFNAGIAENTNLNRFFLANLLVFVLPGIFLIFPTIIWKHGQWSNKSSIICKKILSFQIVWTIISVSFVALTIVLIRLFGGQYTVGQFVPTPLLVYLALCLLNVYVVYRIVQSLKHSSANWASRIPDLF